MSSSARKSAVRQSTVPTVSSHGMARPGIVRALPRLGRNAQAFRDGLARAVTECDALGVVPEPLTDDELVAAAMAREAAREAAEIVALFDALVRRPSVAGAAAALRAVESLRLTALVVRELS